jgi:hypothetical protein
VHDRLGLEGLDDGGDDAEVGEGLGRGLGGVLVGLGGRRQVGVLDGSRVVGAVVGGRDEALVRGPVGALVGGLADGGGGQVRVGGVGLRVRTRVVELVGRDDAFFVSG